MPPSRLDAVYRSILLTKFFTKGWGKPENLKRIFEFRKVVANREACYNLIPRDYPITITKDEEWSDCHILEGFFLSPFEYHLPNLMPEETRNAYFQVILPSKWTSHKTKPMCLHLAGTGDHFFWRRRNLIAKPLLKESGIGSILLENPFYGLRKPKDQIRSSLHNVSDIFIMGGCLIMESIVLLNWCEQQGFGPLGLTGLSMGGHMASLAATNWPKPIPLVPCLSWSTASPVFTQGVMSASINWELLESQYFSNKEYQNDLAKMVKIIDQDDAFLAGQHFAKHYPESMFRVNELKREVNVLEGDTNGISNNQNNHTDRTSNNNQSNSDENNKDNNTVDSNSIKNATNLRIAEEKAAAKLFPLNLISNKFKVGESNVLKGKPPNLACHLAIPSIQNSINLNCPSYDSHLVTSNMKLRRDVLVTGVCLLPVSKHPLFSDNKWREREALQFMRGMMDECTHLSNFEVPVDTELIIAVCARDDAYVPREGCMSLKDIWPGAEIRFIDAGHVTAYLLHQKLFRSTIIEAFERAMKKYPIDDS